MLPSEHLPDAVFDALGSAVRRQLLLRLADAPQSVGALASAFPISRPAISRHLGVLEEAGLVSATGVGARNVYSLVPDGFAATAAWLDAFWSTAERRLQLLAENLPPPDRDNG